MTTNLEMLNNCPICKGVSPQVLENIVEISTAESFDQDEHIYIKGDSAHGFYLLTSGRVKLNNISNQGTEFITSIIKVGQVFGQDSILIGDSFSENAVALEESEALYVPIAAFKALCTKENQLLKNIISSLCHQITNLKNLIEDQQTFSARDKIINYILEHKVAPDEAVLTEKKYQVAGQLGIRPETFSRVLKKLEKEKLVVVQGRKVKISHSLVPYS